MLAKRSPGSTLKPFLYALAIDQGLIHPLSILTDAPTAFGPFQPENFDGRFVGPISARDALIRSRNVPAVWLASQLHNVSLYDFLHHAGISRLHPESHYGLSLILGGGELSMEELVGLYAMLGNGGMQRPLRYRLDDPQIEGFRLLSPESSFLVRDMLSANPRPDGRKPGLHSWKTAWKTGTSCGFRDAWTIGLTGEYVLAVWLGNFDGRSNQALIGIKAASPLFFRIADGLALTLINETPKADQPPAGLVQVEVCAASGDLPNRWCPQTASTWFIPGVSPIRVSTIHRPVIVENGSGQAACPPYDPEHTHREIFEFWPSDIQHLFREAGLPRRLPPPPASGCAEHAVMALPDEPPRLLSPLEGVVYTLRLSRPDETIGLAAASGAGAEHLFWFTGNRYLGSTGKEDTLPWRPGKSGSYELTVVDDLGRRTGRALEVEFVP